MSGFLSMSQEKRKKENNKQQPLTREGRSLHRLLQPPVGSTAHQETETHVGGHILMIPPKKHLQWDWRGTLFAFALRPCAIGVLANPILRFSPLGLHQRNTWVTRVMEQAFELLQLACFRRAALHMDQFHSCVQCQFSCFWFFWGETSQTPPLVQNQ